MCKGTSGNFLCLAGKPVPLHQSDIETLSDLFNDAETKEQQDRADEVLREVLEIEAGGELFNNSYMKIKNFSEVAEEMTGLQLSTTNSTDWEKRKAKWGLTIIHKKGDVDSIQKKSLQKRKREEEDENV